MLTTEPGSLAGMNRTERNPGAATAFRAVGTRNATADRMTVRAEAHVREIVQQIVDELAGTHRGVHPELVVEAIQLKWLERAGSAAPPLAAAYALQYAVHVSNGVLVRIVAQHEVAATGRSTARHFTRRPAMARRPRAAGRTLAASGAVPAQTRH